DATAARGSSALTDGVRWQANLDAVPHPDNPKTQHPDLAVLRVVKNNYGWFPPPLALHRDRDHGGALRAATKREIDEYKEAAQEAEIENKTDRAKITQEARKRASADNDTAAGWLAMPLDLDPNRGAD